ncbi:calcium-dependent lipid-binding protein-like [Silene latifolia]|uniref:calcium-dependent lipid-binding protein-like n=1 Tax=Silene latifolia TaxID=37657 RepID=UPI003D76F75C
MELMMMRGMMLGITVGITLMAGWKISMQRRSKYRTSKAAEVKALASLGRDELNKILGDSFPSWISFPDFEQADWVNMQLTKLWPYIGDAADFVIRESVEPLLEDYRSPGISSLKLKEFSLGNVAPKIEGIRVQTPLKSQIMMDIDLRWGGDPSIILNVEAADVATIPLQLKDLEVFTVIRLIFQLSEVIPCISAVAVSLLADPEPRIDFTVKAVGGSLTALPGISDMIDETVKSIITDQLQWPQRIIIPITDPVDASALELKPQGKLTVTIVKANDLQNKDLVGKSDPYAVIYIRPRFKVKTKVVDDNLNPFWNETFDVIVQDQETQSLIIQVFDKDPGYDQKLGITKLRLNDLVSDTPTEFLQLKLGPSLHNTYVKHKKDSGTITIKVVYHVFNKDEQNAAWEAEKKMIIEAGLKRSSRSALNGAASLVGSGIGMVGSGIGTGVGLIGSGLGAVGSGLSKAGKFSGRLSITGRSRSKRSE